MLLKWLFKNLSAPQNKADYSMFIYQNILNGPGCSWHDTRVKALRSWMKTWMRPRYQPMSVWLQSCQFTFESLRRAHDVTVISMQRHPCAISQLIKARKLLLLSFTKCPPPNTHTLLSWHRLTLVTRLVYVKRKSDIYLLAAWIRAFRLTSSPKRFWATHS